ncbi:hypothetical protein MIR68_004911 [Amoeboaphelidium protococcarum]|nr:hypothetical protein MIR68_004911 [Amoeboaphelidium protococcarum]
MQLLLVKYCQRIVRTPTLSYQRFRVHGRRFGTWSNSLESKAAQNPSVAEYQNQLYRELLQQSISNQSRLEAEQCLKEIVSRIESRQFALDIQGAKYYVEALNRLGRGDVALELVMKSFGAGAQQNAGSSLYHQARRSFNSNSQEFGNINTRQHYQQSRAGYEQFSDSAASAVGSKDAPLHVIARPAPPSNRDKLWQAAKIAAVLYIALAIFTTYTDEISKVTSAAKSFSVVNEFDPASEKNKENIITFADIQGVDEAKDELLEVVEFLKDPQKFTRLGGKLPKGILLTGVPGVGKTLLARAIAGEAKVPFLHTSGSEFDEVFVGVGAKRVRDLFTAAKKKGGPCIIFIDEIDAVGGTRNPKDQQFAKMTLNQLLVEMDGFNQNTGIIVIGATNFPESLDKALIRAGRFDRMITVPAPDVAGRLAILKVHTKKVPLSSNVKLNIIARGTAGFSGAELANLVNYAALRAASTAQTHVTQNDLDWARDRIIMGAERKNQIISEKNKELVSYHEAGHAIVALYTEGAIPIHKATIMPRGQALGMVSMLPESDDMNWTRKQLKARLDVAMGGRCSEELIYGDEEVTSGASSDIQNATQVARSMVIRLGMGSRESIGLVDLSQHRGDENTFLSSEMKAAVDKDVKRILEESYERARSLLIEKRTELDRLAKALRTYETLSKEEIELVVKGESLDRPVLPLEENGSQNTSEKGVDLQKQPLA